VRDHLSRRRFLALSGAALPAFLAACGYGSQAPPTATPTLVPPTPSPIPTSTPIRATPTPSATTEQMIGQMLLVGFRGLQIDAAHPIAAAVSTGRLGSTVLFEIDPASQSRNVHDAAQVAALNASLQQFAPTTMLISTDQEGGKVARLDEGHGFPPTKSAEYLGTQDDLALTATHAGAMAATLAAAGINLNLAPVIDLNVNPANPIIGAVGRSFSADPDVVVRHAIAFIDAHHAHGVLCALKHFPGHGSSTADSHKGFVDVTSTWSLRELNPYRDIIDAGKADAIMTAHVFNANLDSVYPATLSHQTITGVLRGELGYDGVVITDDMQMGAIRDQFGLERSIELAINAGVDIIALANQTGTYDPLLHERAFVAIQQAAESGRIRPERIAESYGRIMALKSRLAAV
jgi:beta-N-acetylhexosaminidase